EYFNQDAKYIIESGDDLFNFPGLTYCRTSQDSKKINDVIGAKVVIAGSGMSAGGRILHHERRYLSDEKSTLLFIGFQAEGTLGRKIFDGKKEVNIFDEKIPVKCRVESIGGYSAHADQPTLLNWITKGAEGGHLKKVFAVQGETTSATTLAELIIKENKVEAVVPEPNQTIEL
nr:MBL fold metallo-hydrolase [Candidatus Paceibacterota bacterium]